MDFEKIWRKALAETEIIRPRVQSLFTFRDTPVPYILLSESSINVGDTVVRRGEVVVEQPSLVLPPNHPQFEGFEDRQNNMPLDDNGFLNFLLVRGVQLPSLRYSNKSVSLDLYEGSVSKAADSYLRDLQVRENVNTGLLIGPEDYWPLSVLIYVCSQVGRNAPADIQVLLDRWHKRRKNDSHG